MISVSTKWSSAQNKFGFGYAVLKSSFCRSLLSTYPLLFSFFLHALCERERKRLSFLTLNKLCSILTLLPATFVLSVHLFFLLLGLHGHQPPTFHSADHVLGLRLRLHFDFFLDLLLSSAIFLLFTLTKGKAQVGHV